MSELNIQHFDVIDSTNTEACRQIDNAGSLKNLHKKVIAADSQTAGKGRLNRSFYSPKLTGIYMSLIWVLPDADCDTSPNIGAGDFNPALYTATAAVAVTRAIKSVYSIDTKIKWVNDVYLDDKKICGILAEGKINPKTGKIASLVVGIGVNIATPEGDFPDDVKNKAGALFSGSRPICNAMPAGNATFRDELIREIAQNVFKIYENKSSFPDVLNEYREKSNLIGKSVTVSPVINQSETYTAEVLDITENAELKVKLQNGETRILSSGEVSLHQN